MIAVGFHDCLRALEAMAGKLLGLRPPSGPLLADSGMPMLDADAKPRWAPLINFESCEVGDYFSTIVIIIALLGTHRDAFDGASW
jgi:hypothetical protein